MESFSYQTRLGWLPPLSLPPCSWRCTCNLLHPLWWHVLLTILNHPHWGCTYRRLQGQRRYCSKGEKRGKEKCPRHMYLLAQLEEPTNNFLNSLTKNCWGFIYWSKQLADNKASQTKKRCPVLSASKNTSNIASDSVCLWSPSALFLRRSYTDCMMTMLLLDFRKHSYSQEPNFHLRLESLSFSFFFCSELSVRRPGVAALLQQPDSEWQACQRLEQIELYPYVFFTASHIYPPNNLPVHLNPLLARACFFLRITH